MPHLGRYISSMFRQTFFSFYETRLTSLFYQTVFSINFAHNEKKWKKENKNTMIIKFYAKHCFKLRRKLKV